MATNLKIKETVNEGLKRAYEVVVPAQKIDETVKLELAKVGEKVKIPGFRPGKVPTKLLQERYGQSVMGEVIERAVREATNDLMSEKKLIPALRPDVKISDNFAEGKDLEFSVTLELMPKAPEVDFSKVKLEKMVVTVSDDEVTSSLERIAANNGENKEKSSKAANGDVVKMDFKGFIGEEAFAGGEGKGFELELGSGQFIPGFEEQLVGAKAGENVTVNVPFPADYHSKDLAGKNARFECTVHAVMGKVPAKLDDEFAKKLGLESLEKLKDVVRDQLANDFEGLVRNRLKKKLFDVLDEQTGFDVPEGMVKLEFDAIWQQYEQAKARGQVDDDVSEEELKKEYQAIAQRRVRMGILLSQIAGAAKLEVTTEELRQAIFDQARAYPGQERQIFEFYNKHPEHVNELRGPILEEKAVDHILTKITLTEKKVSTADIVKMDEEEDEAANAKKKPAKKAAKTDDVVDAEKPAKKVAKKKAE